MINGEAWRKVGGMDGLIWPVGSQIMTHRSFYPPASILLCLQYNSLQPSLKLCIVLLFHIDKDKSKDKSKTTTKTTTKKQKHKGKNNL